MKLKSEKNEKVKIIFLVLFMGLITQYCKEKNTHLSDIQTNIDSVQMNKKWQSINYEDGEKIYFPITWIAIDHFDYTLYLKAGNDLYFYLDIMQKNQGSFDQLLVNNTKGFILKENKISKINFRNSKSILYYTDILGDKKRKFREISNYFDDGRRIYRFTIFSNQPFSDQYVDTLNIITNTYFLKNNIRLVPIKNGYQSVDFLEAIP